MSDGKKRGGLLGGIMFGGGLVFIILVGLVFGAVPGLLGLRLVDWPEPGPSPVVTNITPTPTRSASAVSPRVTPTSKDSGYQTRYYSVSLPASLSNASIRYDEGHLGGPLSVGVSTAIMVNGRMEYEITCLSNDWGPQTDSGVMKLGSPSSNPSCTVYVLASWDRQSGESHDAAQRRAREFARNVTLR